MKSLLVPVSMTLFLIFSNEEQLLLKESFDYEDGKLPSAWWSEGNAAVIKDGRLFVDADIDSFRASTVWLDHNLSGNIRIEFDVHVVASSDTANNINCFFLYSDPSGKSLMKSKDERGNAAYNHYHKLNGYIFTYLANGSPARARFRFRNNPGFNLLAESFGFECKVGVTYHIKIIKTENRFQYWVNERKLCDEVVEQASLHNSGLFGFRTWHTSLWWDNLVIAQFD